MDQTQFYSMMAENEMVLAAAENKPSAPDGDKVADAKDCENPSVLQHSQQERQQPLSQQQRRDGFDASSTKENQPPACLKENDTPVYSTAARVKFDDNPKIAFLSEDCCEAGESKDPQKKEEDNLGQPSLPIKTKVDRFVEHFGASGAPSPIKSFLPPAIVVSAAETDSQASLELKVNDTFVVADRSTEHVSKCIQPEGSELSLDQSGHINLHESQQDETMPSAVIDDSGKINIQATEDSTEDAAGKDAAGTIGDLKDKELLSRKRSQNEMEPAAFELPRATKYPHKDFPALPEFRGGSPPLITFSTGHEDVFRPHLSSKDACIQNVQSFEEDMSVQEMSANFGLATSRDEEHQGQTATAGAVKEQTPSKGGVQDKDSDSGTSPQTGPQSPSTDLNRTSTDYFNKTLDMTLRSSGFGACGLGMFLAIDEMLDPAISPIVPYGLRRRGANIVIFLTSLLLAMLVWLFIL